VKYKNERTTSVWASIIMICLFACLLRGPAKAEDWQDVANYVKQYQGKWDVQLTARATEIRQLTFHGTMVSNVIGDRWVLSDLTTFGGQGFAGHEVLGYDGKKWVAVWVDDTEPHMFIDEGERTKTGVKLESHNVNLKKREGASTLPLVDLRTDEWNGPDQYSSHFFRKNPDGSLDEFMTITLRRVAPGAQKIAADKLQ